jgi:hypothetical protein
MLGWSRSLAIASPTTPVSNVTGTGDRTTLSRPAPTAPAISSPISRTVGDSSAAAK